MADVASHYGDRPSLAALYLRMGRLEGWLCDMPAFVNHFIAYLALKSTWEMISTAHGGPGGALTREDSVLRPRDPALCVELLDVLAQSPWPILAQVAQQLRLAQEGQGAEMGLTRRVASIQRDVTAAMRRSADISPLERLHLALDSIALDGPTETAEQHIDAPGAPIQLSTGAKPLESWPINLCLPHLLMAAKFTTAPCPLYAGVRPIALRADMSPAERFEALAHGLGVAAEKMEKAVQEARALWKRFQAALPHRRSSSRAWQVLAAIAVFSPVRRSPLAECLGMTLAGLDTSLASLSKAKLITLTQAGFSMMDTAESVDHPGDDIDTALKDLDAILDQYGER